MNRKLICSDLDGTLLNKDKQISTESTRILKALSSQGHYICFITGRALSDAIKYYEQLGLNTLCVCNNGAAIHNPSDQKFDNIFFPMNSNLFFKLWDSKDIQDQIEYFVIKTKHHTFTNKIPTEQIIKTRFKSWFHIDFGTIKNPKKEALIYSKRDRHSDILSIILVLKPNVDPHDLYYAIKKNTNNILITQWSIDDRSYKNNGQIILELNHNFANKLNALKFLQSYYDVLWNDTYVFGDGENDTAMLRTCDNSWSMKNSGPHAITVGHNITKYDNDHDGVAKVLEELLMPK